MFPFKNASESLGNSCKVNRCSTIKDTFTNLIFSFFYFSFRNLIFSILNFLTWKNLTNEMHHQIYSFIRYESHGVFEKTFTYITTLSGNLLKSWLPRNFFDTKLFIEIMSYPFLLLYFASSVIFWKHLKHPG